MSNQKGFASILAIIVLVVVALGVGVYVVNKTAEVEVSEPVVTQTPEANNNAETVSPVVPVTKTTPKPITPENDKTIGIEPPYFQLNPKVVNLIPQDDNGVGSTHVLGDKDNIIALTFNHPFTTYNSLAEFQQNLTNKSFHVPFPEKQVPGSNNGIPHAWEADLQAGTGIQVTFTSYENGRLKGQLMAKLRQLSYWVNAPQDPNCITDDMAGRCVKYIPGNIDLQINFDFKIK